jgi:uncharacterized membrane protein (DUF485 family)
MTVARATRVAGFVIAGGVPKAVATRVMAFVIADIDYVPPASTTGAKVSRKRRTAASRRGVR